MLNQSKYTYIYNNLKQHKQTCKQTGETFKPVKSVKTIYNRCKLNKDMATNKY